MISKVLNIIKTTIISMKRIVLKCPICHSQKFQLLPESLIIKRNENEKGICVIMIPEDTICEHLFFVHIDRNFSIRDCVSGDYIKERNLKKVIRYNTIEKLLQSLSTKTKQNILSRL